MQTLPSFIPHSPTPYKPLPHHPQTALKPQKYTKLPTPHLTPLIPKLCSTPPRTQLWFTAAKRGDILTLTKLIRTGQIPTALITHHSTNRTAFHYAAANANVPTIRALYELARGVGAVRQDFGHHTHQALKLVNMPDNDRKTPLHLAAGRTDPHAESVVFTLLALGARITPDSRGFTPLDVAVLPGVVYLLNSRK